jgi:NAD(P)H-flavin reductase/ferredoxin
MITVEYNNKKYLVNNNDSVLKTLLKNESFIPYSCQNGICQSCIMKVVEGNIPKESQKGLSENQIEENNFLPCICKPKENIKIDSTSSHSKIYDAEIKNIIKKTEDIIILTITCADPLNYKPGQFINLINDKNISRSYSLASHPELSTDLELHIKLCSHGIMTNWIFNDLKIRDKLKIAGPNGYCYYTQKCKQKPLLLICVGTGLSPILGILKEALFQKHENEIHLIHGSYRSSGLYLFEEIKNIQKKNNHLTFYPCAIEIDDHNQEVQKESIQTLIENKFPDLSNWEIFICGSEEFVKEMEQQCFLQEAELDSIHSDAFVENKKRDSDF